MNMTIIGASDSFARGLAVWAVASGHHVTVVGFNRSQAETLVTTIRGAKPSDPSDPLVGHVVLLAMPYDCVLDAWGFYGRQLDGKIVVDVTTPIDRDRFEPIHPEAGSVAQEIAKGRPAARIVKAFHPAFAGPPITDGATPGERNEVFLASDDAEAKRVVARLFTDGGLHPIDVGPLRRAREIEGAGYIDAARRASFASRPAAGRTRAAS